MRLSSPIWKTFFVFISCWPSKIVTEIYTSYRLSPFCNAIDDTRYPTTSDEVVAIVDEAIDRNVKVKAFGARHSQSDIICTEGIPVDMSKMKSYQMNADEGTATFGAGVTLREAGEFLLLHGRALRTTPAYGNITLGGAIGTGAHGSSIKYNSSISAQVIRMTVVNGLGEVVVISKSEDLKSFKTHLGLLGIIVDVTLYTVPQYKVFAHNYVVSDIVLTNGVALDWARTSDQIMFYWFPAYKEVVVANLTFVSVDTPGEAYTSIVPPSYGFFNFAAKQAKEIAYTLTSSECAPASTLGNRIVRGIEVLAQSSIMYQTPGFVPIYTEDGTTIKNPAVGYPHEMLASICSEEDAGLLGTACLWAHEDINARLSALDMEFGISVTNLTQFVAAVKDIQTKTPIVFPLQGIIMRFSGRSDIYMSTAYERDTTHIEFFAVKRSDEYNDSTGSLAGYQTIAQTKQLTGRSHWGKSGFVYHSREMLDLKLDPIARELFIDAMENFDPNQVFLNNFGRRLTKVDTKIDIDPLTTRCALLDNCFCTKNADCAVTQSCKSLPGYNYNVCKTNDEIPEQHLDKSLLPPPSALIDWLLLTVPSLAKAVLAECAVGEIISSVGPILG